MFSRAANLVSIANPKKQKQKPRREELKELERMCDDLTNSLNRTKRKGSLKKYEKILRRADERLESFEDQAWEEQNNAAFRTNKKGRGKGRRKVKGKG